MDEKIFCCHGGEGGSGPHGEGMFGQDEPGHIPGGFGTEVLAEGHILSHLEQLSLEPWFGYHFFHKVPPHPGVRLHSLPCRGLGFLRGVCLSFFQGALCSWKGQGLEEAEGDELCLSRLPGIRERAAGWGNRG